MARIASDLTNDSGLAEGSEAEAFASPQPPRTLDAGAQDSLIPAPGREPAVDLAKLATHGNQARSPSQNRQDHRLQSPRYREHLTSTKTLARTECIHVVGA